LDVAGKGPAPSPSNAEVLARGGARNGWRFWRVDRDGKSVRLEAVRDELIAEHTTEA
jgi:hypothetical protein